MTARSLQRAVCSRIEVCDKAEPLLEAATGTAPSSSPPGAALVACPYCPLINSSTRCQGKSSWILCLVFLVLVVGRAVGKGLAEDLQRVHQFHILGAFRGL